MDGRNKFSEIYAQWEKTHNEDESIAKRVETEQSSVSSKITLNELHRMRVQDELDLHSVRCEDAIDITMEFLNNAKKRKLNKVRIITGKGLHSPNGQAVIRPLVIETLNSCRFVREIDANPKPCDGGSGALIVLLK